MRLKNIPGSREKIAESEYAIKPSWPENTALAEDAGPDGEGNSAVWTVKGSWSEVFGNDRPIHIEIGMGKGTFLMELARKNPDINYVGIEKYSSVLLRAIQKQEERKLPNIRFIRMDAEYICDVFAEGEVSKIYLNFSDPWPKDRHARRRLTSREFLKRYEKLFGKADRSNACACEMDPTTPSGDIDSTKKTAPPENSSSDIADRINEPLEDRGFSDDFGIIEFKTDNVGLFEFSLEEAEQAGWQMIAYTYDLKNDSLLNEGNIMTEYEKKFSELGQKICKMVIKMD